MTHFPIETLCPTNLRQTLKKMDYGHLSRMRQTCRQINEIVELIMESKRSSGIAVEEAMNLFLWIGELFDPPVVTPCIEYNWRLLPGAETAFHNNYQSFRTIADLKQIKWAIFNNITVIGTPCPFFNSRGQSTNALEVISKAKLKCHQLQIRNGVVDKVDIVELYKITGASSVLVGYNKGNEHHCDVTAPLHFDIIRKLGKTGCKHLDIQYCDALPDYYTVVLSRFETISIGNVENGGLAASFSLASLIRMFVSDGPSILLKCFRLPVYNFIWDTVMDELELQKWPVNQEEATINCFIKETDKHYFVLKKYQGDQPYCTGHRIPKDEMVKTIEWFGNYKNIAFDASELHSYIEDKRKNARR